MVFFWFKTFDLCVQQCRSIHYQLCDPLKDVFFFRISDWISVWDVAESCMVCLRVSPQIGFCVPVLAWHSCDCTSRLLTTFYFCFFNMSTWSQEMFGLLLTATSASAQLVQYKLFWFAALKTKYLMDVCWSSANTHLLPSPSLYLNAPLHQSVHIYNFWDVWPDYCLAIPKLITQSFQMWDTLWWTVVVIE